MQVFNTLPISMASCAVTVGTFDGLHLGHRKIIAELMRVSKEKKLVSTVVTFYPHPRKVLFPQKKLGLILSQEEKIDVFKTTGVQNLVILPFTKEFSKLSAEEFLKFLVEQLNMKYLASGFNNHFGCDRISDAVALSRYGKKYGFTVEKIAAVSGGDNNISSTLIRDALTNGDMETTFKMLGYRYFILGEVVHGRQIGRTIGFPTANIKTGENKLLPQSGVYVALTTIGENVYRSLLNIGSNPTVSNEQRITIENHLLGFSGNLYGQQIKVEPLTKLRGEQKFDSINQLKNALLSDKEMAEKYFDKKNVKIFLNKN